MPSPLAGAPQPGRRAAVASPRRRSTLITRLLVLPAAVAIMTALVGVPAEAGASRSGGRDASAQTTARSSARAPARTTARPRATPRRVSVPARSAAAKPARGRPAPTVPVFVPPVFVPDADPALLAMLHSTARRTGAEPALLAAMAWRESRFDPDASNPLSSARGLMQFTDAAWLEAVRDHGPSHGLAQDAALLLTDPATGTVSTRDPHDLRRILALRFDPQVSAALAAERAVAIRPGLQAALRRRPTAAELYAVHLLGQAGARRFYDALARRPSHSAADVVGRDVASRNRGVFYAAGGRAFSLREVQAGLLRTAATGHALAAASARPATAQVEVASAEDVPRPPR